ncbi:MAG: NUDIX hydrolase [Candidatus Wenzhouxiangella sp. M2_3B_020]
MSGPPSETAALADQLADYRSRHPNETETVDRFLALLDGHPNCFDRDCWAGHVTGSAWLLDPDRSDVLLTHHRKLDIWVQPGGHCDGDPDTLAVARREAEEESGLAVEVLSPEILDIDIHEIPARRHDPRHAHFDVRYAFISTSGRKYTVTDESHDLQWVSIDEIHRYAPDESILRMARKWANR